MMGVAPPEGEGKFLGGLSDAFLWFPLLPSLVSKMVKKRHGSKSGDWLYVGQQGVGHSTRNRQAHLSSYGVPTAILAGSTDFCPKTGLTSSSSSKRQIAPANLASDPQVARSM